MRDAIQDPILWPRVETPELRFAEVGQTRAIQVAKQPKQAKDQITEPRGIGHDFHRP
jgi:hypothetical protein